jgi:release factor glutamine methyltransferase
VTTGVDALVARLRTAGCVFAEDEARLLLGTGARDAELEALVSRRIAGEPLDHVLGWSEFAGLRIIVEPGVFVPRPRTEYLAERAVALALAAGEGAVVVDLCCGAGALGAAVLDAVPGIELHAADVDPVATSCARRNLPGIPVHDGDLFDALPTSLQGRIEVLVANVPYVPTTAIASMPAEAREFEPHVALDGGADGLDVARRVAAGAATWLAPGGSLLIETSEHQSRAAAAMFEDTGLASSIDRDDERDATVVTGRRAALPRRASDRPRQ